MSVKRPHVAQISVLIVLLLTLFPSFLRADERVDPIEGTSDSASEYSLLSNGTPGMAIVITQEQIQSRGYRSVYEILRDLPGFTTRGAFGESPVILSMDGDKSQGNEKFLLFIDGVLEQDLWRRSIWLSHQYSVHFIKNITVFYGPAATRFGANAMSGIIFIDTKKAEDLGEGHGDISLTKDIRTGMWALDLMFGHSYNRRTSPHLAKNLFSWYLRGRLYLSDDRNSKYNERWNPTNVAVTRFFNERVNEYCDDYKQAYGIKTSGCNQKVVQEAITRYRSKMIDEYVRDLANSGLYANPSYRNRNQSVNGELGLRFDNWFLRFFIWSMATGSDLRYPAYNTQTNHLWTVRNLSLSLHHLKSEIWSSGVGEKAQVIYFNLNMTYQRHEVPGSSLRVRFAPHKRVFFDRICRDPTDQHDIPCTWKEYYWTPTYYYVVSSSFRAEPKLDFRLLEGKLQFSLGVNTGIAFIQGHYSTSNRPEPQHYADNSNEERGAGNQYEHTYLSIFLQGDFAFTSWLSASFGLRSDWELVRGELEIVPNCERSITPCYRFSAPLVGRGSLIMTMGKIQARLSYGYAFLSPSNWQLFGGNLEDSLDARDLLPQDKHSVELNVFANIASKFFFTVSVFHHWLNNVNAIVVLPYKQNRGQTFNIGNQMTLGSRFYSVLRAVPWMDVIANFAFLYPRLDVIKDNNDAPIHLEDVPLLQANLGFDLRSDYYDRSHFFGSLRLNLQTSRTNIGFNQLENGQIEVVKGSTVKTYVILHLSAGYLWRPPEKFPFLKLLVFSATAENLLNTEYYDLGIRSGREPNFSSIVPQPGFNAYFKLSAEF